MSPPSPVSGPPVWVFAGVILFGAFLLFQVQPLAGKYILPWFGGAPAVWTTCLLFFQSLLFGGYLYAHFMQRIPAAKHQALVHLVLVILAALLTTPIGPGDFWKPTDSSQPVLRILLLLLATVGLPYFVLAGTSPLIQAWFSQSRPGRSPYRLYALSNVGSLAALLSYPFVFEPAFRLDQQAWLWSGVFLAYGLLCALCAWRLWNAPPAFQGAASAAHAKSGEPVTAVGGVAAPHTAAGERPKSPAWWQRVLWLLLPAIASMMLMATTNHLCQDVAVVPFLWVLPLTLYLLSFIICFDHARWYVRWLWAGAAAVAVLAVAAYETEWRSEWMGGEFLGLAQYLPDYKFLGPLAYILQGFEYEDFRVQLALAMAGLFFGCMVCHGELVRLRPQPRYLTEFYLMIAAGGALGGASVSILAPLVFNSFLEWPIGLTLFFAVSVAALVVTAAKMAIWIVYSWHKWSNPRRWVVASAAAIFFLAALTGIVGYQRFLRDELLEIGSLYKASLSETDDTVLAAVRNFYGAIKVEGYGGKEGAKPGDPDGPDQLELTHGIQYFDYRRREPVSYYVPESGVGQAVRFFQRKPAPVRIGVVGLGTGTMAAFGRKGDVVRFYEINPAVLEIARTWFTYLRDSPAKVEVELGDARLTLERELAENRPQGFHVLALDAFSSDAIPTHLLTNEAFAVYDKHLAPDGVLAVHISNRYLDLSPVVRKLADKHGFRVIRIDTDYPSEWSTRFPGSGEGQLVFASSDEETIEETDEEWGEDWEYEDDYDPDHYGSDWILVTRNEAMIAKIANRYDETEDVPLDEAPLWTDDYSNLFQILK
ncbi:MAG: spermidine synthase [Planctomycetota bacterium]